MNIRKINPTPFLRSFTLAGILLSWLLSAASATAAGPAVLIRGIVHDPDHSPVAGALLVLGQGPGGFETRSGKDGSFEFLPGDKLEFPLQLEVSAPGFEKLQLRLEQAGTELEITLSRKTSFHGVVEVTGSRARSGETPVPMSLLERKEIEEKDRGQDVPMLLQGTPGFYAYNDNGNGMGYSYFFLRGFDMRRTAVSLNGVPLNDAASHGVYFVDLNSFLSTTDEVEVQRGVGRSLYGGSAIGGSVDLRTSTPSSTPGFHFRMMGGSWNTQRFEVQGDSGLINGEWAASFRYSKTSSDGYRDQSWLDAWNYFFDLDHYSEHATTRLILFGGPERTHLAYEGVTQAWLRGEITGNRRKDRRHNPLSYPGEIDDFFQPHYQIIDTRQLKPGLILQNTLYYFEGEGYYKQYKEDRWMPEYGLEPFPGPDGSIINTTDLIRKRAVDESDLGWIPSLEWKHAGGRGKLQAGFAIRLHDSRHTGRVVWAQYYPPETEPNKAYYDYDLSKTSFQPFLEENWSFNDRLSLLAGLSWTSHRYRLAEDRLDDMKFSRSYHYLLPRLGLNFRVNGNLSFYGSISCGDFELGATAAAGAFSAQLNLFYLDFDNEIVWAGGIDSDGLPTTANGAKTTHYGAELDARWNPDDHFGIRMTASFNHATFDHFIEYDWDGNEIDHRGNHIAGAPEWMGSLEVQGAWGPAHFFLVVHDNGKFYLDNTEDERKRPDISHDPDYIHKINPSYTSIDLSMQLDLGSAFRFVSAKRAGLDLRICNLTDSLFTTYGYVWGPEPTWIPAATRSFYAGLSLDW